ncbi:MAG: hypothetical protein ACI9XR_001080 [Flavobacterium sp.]|jgi:hypothetical protein
MSRNKLYTILLIACFLGFSYFIYSFNFEHSTFCVLKKITSFPCPACGNTRAILLLIQGKFVSSLLLNPLGIVVFLAMLIVPIWIIVDLIKTKNSFFIAYKKIEKFLQKKSVAIPLLILILANWTWNIYKKL